MIANMNEKGRQTKLLAAVAVFAMVVCALAVVMPSAEESYGVEAPAGAVQIDTSDELTEAMTSGDGEVYSLIDDISVTGVVNVTKANVTLYLNGHSITSTSTTEGSVFDLVADRNTQFTIYGTGSIVNSVTGSSSCIIDVRVGDTLTLNENVTLTSGGYGIGAWSGSTVVVNNATIRAEASAISGNGTNNDANVTINGGSFTSTIAAAIYFPSSENLDINGGTFTGLNGIEIRAGKVTIDNATIDATGSLTNNKVDPDGPLDYGMAVAIIDRSGYGASDVEIGNTVVLNGSSYDVYVGDVNGTSGNTGSFNTATIGEKYTPANGAKLTMPGIIYQTSTSTETYRFAATDVTATSFTLPAGYVINGTVSFDANNSATLAEIEAGNGGITFRQGSVTISGNIVSGSGDASSVASAISSITGEVVLTNLTITSGTLDISDDVSVSGNVIVAEEAAIEIQSGVTLTVQPNSTLSVSGTVDGDGTLENNGTVAVTNTQATIPDKITGTGTVDTSGVASEGTLSGTYDTTTTFTRNQTITATGNITLVTGTIFTFEGTFIIPEGITVTIESGAQLIANSSTGTIINNGTIIIESQDVTLPTGSTVIDAYDGGLVIANTATLTNNGVIELAYMSDDLTSASKPQLFIDGATVTNNGQVNVGEDSRLDIESDATFVNASGATVNMSGYYEGPIQNAGTVVIDGEVSAVGGGAVTIYMTAAGASIEIVNLQGELAINDTMLDTTNMTVTDSSGADNANNVRKANYMRFVSGTNSVLSGITITSEISTIRETGSTTTNYYNNMVIAGAVSTSFVSGYTPVSDTETPNADMIVNGNRILVTGELSIGANVDVTNNGIMVVSGTVSVDTNADVNGGTINVTTGTVVAANKRVGSTVYAAEYSVRTTNPVGTTYYYTTLANALASGATPITITGNMTVEEALTIPDGITVNQTGGYTLTISEDGSITVANGGRLNSTTGVTVNGSLYAEDKRTGLRGTNNITSEVKSEGDADILYTNLVNALTNAESGDDITLSNDATIRSNVSIYEGVTLRTEGHNVTIANDVTFTIDGTLYFNSNTGSLILAQVTNPDLSQPGEVVLNGVIQSDVPLTYTENGAYPAGAYYSITSNGRMVYYIQPLDDAVANIATFDDSTIQVYGDVTVGDISVTGTADESAIIVINDKLTAGTITLDNAQIQIVQGAIIDAVIANGVGSIDMVAAGGAQTNANLTISSAANTAGETELTVTGIVSDTVGNDLRYAFTVADSVNFGASTVPGMTVDGTAIIDARLTVTGTLTINGTVNVETNGTLSATGRTVLLGDLNIAPVSTEGRGTAQVADIYIGLSYSSTDGISTGADATVTGTLSVSGTAYVSAGSTVPANFCENSDSTEFYVEDALWLTAYGTSATVDNAPVTDADFSGWDNPATTAEETISGVDIDLADYARLDAIIDYNVYYIEVYTDGGISSVAIDGVLLMNEGNKFYNVDGAGFKAGEHKLSYTLKNGFTGEATMTIGGQAVSGDTFTLGGDYNVKTVINLAGTEPVTSGGEIIVNTGSDDMSLTDILLIVLVVLIVIMAVIVALRLMRS